MKLIIRIIFIGAITYFASPFGAWWICMIAAFTVSFISPSSGLNAFIAGFLGVGLVWMGYAWTIDIENGSEFASKIAALMAPLNNSFQLVLAAGAIGGIAGGFASITGKTFKALFVKPKKKSFYS